MPLSINTNIAAYYSQANIATSNRNVVSSSARLSSGNRIVQASDDVAALSIGTSLKSQVTTLRQALTNASQGTSLLQVADGALGQVVDLLQRQKALTVNAGSGSLSDTDRSYLDLEFQALSNEINRLAASTNFSGVNLIDGSLSGATTVKSNVANGTSTAGTTAGNVIAIAAGNAANNDQITVNGVVVNFTTATPGSSAAVGRVTIGNSNTETAANLAAFLNRSNDARLAGLTFTATAGNLTANYGGGLLNGAYTVAASIVTGANITTGTAANRTIAVTNPTDGLSVDKTKAVGDVTGTILVNGGILAAVAGQAINTRAIEDNASFIGKFGGANISKITGSYTGTADTATFQVETASGITYSTGAQDITNAAAVTLTFTGADITGAAAGGSFTLTIRGGATIAFTSQAQLDSVVNQINDSLSGVTITQNRDVTTFQQGQVVNVSGVQVGTLQGASANFNSGDFSDVKIEQISITAPAAGNVDAVFEAVVNGQTYRSFAGIGNQIGLNTAISLQNLSDPTKSITIVTGNTPIAGSTTVALDLSNQANADAAAKALQDAFGLTGAGAKLSFQVGNRSSDTLGVQIKSVETSEIYGGATPKVDTLSNAAAAGVVIDTALVKVTSARASVGALQSRFNFASTNIQTALQNQDAARGVLLDTDVAAESTAYATYQVQLQAGISVLAQANQLNQATLQLLQ
ncbi:MAG: flagellin [Alphaproteobacteria bacterium]